MDESGHEQPRVVYTTPARVQAWFLHRSRENWKRKYGQLKADAKRLQNRVHDVAQSRQRWRHKNQELAQRLRALEAENAALHEQVAALKKGG